MKTEQEKLDILKRNLKRHEKAIELIEIKKTEILNQIIKPKYNNARPHDVGRWKPD